MFRKGFYSNLSYRRDQKGYALPQHSSARMIDYQIIENEMAVNMLKLQSAFWENQEYKELTE